MEKLNLNVGDKVVIRGNYRSSIASIEKVTPKGFYRIHGTLYDEYGYQKGGDAWSRTSISKVTEEYIEEQRKKNVILKAERFLKENKMTYELANEILKYVSTEQDELKGE